MSREDWPHKPMSEHDYLRTHYEDMKAMPTPDLNEFDPPTFVYPQPAEAYNMPPILLMGIINSALYLSAVFIAGLWWSNHLASNLAIADMGVCYLTALVQVSWPRERPLAAALVGLSIVVGVAAGFSLLTGT